jgi:hypothetical protein
MTGASMICAMNENGVLCPLAMLYEVPEEDFEMLVFHPKYRLLLKDARLDASCTTPPECSRHV